MRVEKPRTSMHTAIDRYEARWRVPKKDHEKMRYAVNEVADLIWLARSIVEERWPENDSPMLEAKVVELILLSRARQK